MLEEWQRPFLLLSLIEYFGRHEWICIFLALTLAMLFLLRMAWYLRGGAKDTEQVFGQWCISMTRCFSMLTSFHVIIDKSLMSIIIEVSSRI